MTATIHILHVEDDPDFADLTATHLQRADAQFTITTVRTVRTAQDHLREDPVDCIVSDHNLPDETGIGFLRTVRDEFPDLPFILFTDKGSEEIASDAISAGVTDYLQKGGGTDKFKLLTNRLVSAVENHRRQRTLERQSDLFRKTQRLANVGAWEYDPIAEEAHFSELIYDIYGVGSEYDPDPETDIERFYHPDDQDTVRTATRRALEAGEEYDIEARITAADGTKKWVRTRGKPEFENGTCQRVRGTLQDITDRKERERDIELQRERLTVALKESKAGVWEWIPDTDDVICHESTERLLGLKPGTFDGTYEAFVEFVHDEDVSTLETTVSEAVETKDPFEVAYRINTADDEMLWVSSRGEFVDIDGLSPRYVGVLSDITGQKQRTLELERTRALFTQAEQLGNLGAWEFDASGDLVWTDGTKRIHEVASGFEPTMEDTLQFFHPDDREIVAQAVENAIENNEPYEHEVRLITANGNQRWVRMRGNALSETDQPTVRGFIQDITQQKERERELQKTNAQLENAIAAGAVGTWEWQIPEDRLVVGKEFAKQFGVDPELAQEGVELEQFISAIHEDDRERVEQEIEAALEACGEYESEYRVFNADGELNWVLARGCVECDETDSPVRFPGVLVDITERKQIERELHRQNNRLNEFTKIVSHDLRNPLTVAGGRLELAQAECDSEHLEAIGQAHERMETLVSDLLTLAQEGEAATDSSTINLQTYTTQCWQNVDTDNATLVADCADKIRADKSKLGQLFENLIRNAVEHGGENVTVTIGELDDGFYIEDDGPGIPEDERDTVFDGGYSTSQDGTGFGLNIVTQVVDAHDWEITVTDGPEGGARFEITGVEFAEE